MRSVDYIKFLPGRAAQCRVYMSNLPYAQLYSRSEATLRPSVARPTGTVWSSGVRPRGPQPACLSRALTLADRALSFFLRPVSERNGLWRIAVSTPILGYEALQDTA